MTRHTVVASAGAADSSAQGQPHSPRRSVRLLSPKRGLQRLQSRIDLILRVMNAVAAARQRWASSRSTRPSTSAVHRWLAPASYHLLRNIGQTLNLSRRCPFRQLGHAAHHRGTVQRGTRKPRRRHKPRRSNEPPTGKRVKWKSTSSDTVEESSPDDSVFRKKHTCHQRESRHYTWTPLHLHTCHFVPRPHQRCSRVVLSPCVST